MYLFVCLSDSARISFFVFFLRFAVFLKYVINREVAECPLVDKLCQHGWRVFFPPSPLFLFHLLATINANTNRFAKTQYWSISVLTQRSKSDWFCKEIRWLFSQRLWIFLGIMVSNCLFMRQCEKAKGLTSVSECGVWDGHIQGILS